MQFKVLFCYGSATHMMTALYVAKHERPLAEFPKLLSLQKDNVLQMLNGKDSDKACGIFLDALEQAMVNVFKKILIKWSFTHFSLMDHKPVKRARRRS